MTWKKIVYIIKLSHRDMFRQHFLDDIFNQNRYKILQEVREKERCELESIPRVDVSNLEQRLENCQRPLRTVQRPTVSLDQSLNNSKRYSEKLLRQQLKVAQQNQVYRRVIEQRRANDVVTVPSSKTYVSKEMKRLEQELRKKTEASARVQAQIRELRVRLNYTEVQHLGLNNHIRALRATGDTETLQLLEAYSTLLVTELKQNHIIAGLQQSLKQATIDAHLHWVVQRPKVQSMHLQQLLYDLRIKRQQSIRLERQVKHIRTQVGYNAPHKHFGLQHHIDQLKKTKSSNDVKQLTFYSELLLEQDTLNETILQMQELATWAQAVQARSDIRRLVQTIIRTDYGLAKLRLLSEQLPVQFEQEYATLLEHQQQSRSKLDRMLATATTIVSIEPSASVRQYCRE